jgi:hypothetical protein
MNKKTIFIIIGIIALLIRLFVNFRFELIPGINGGYYPMQVRQIFDTGWIGFNDMPLYFLLNYLFVWLIDLFTDINRNLLILNTAKIIDACNFVFILFPVYFISKGKIIFDKFIDYLTIALFSVLSISPMILLSDNQKNTFGILLSVIFLSYIISNINNLSFKKIIIATTLLITVLLSHFGTFVILLILILLYLFFTYQKKAVLPIIVITTLSVILISIFDYSRAERMFTFIFKIFEHLAILRFQPPDFLNLIFAVILILFSFNIIKKKSNQVEFKTKFEINFIKANIWLLIILSFPIISDDYFRRFQILTYIPEILLIIFIFRQLSKLQKNTIIVFMLLLVFISIPMIFKEKQPTITYQAYLDLNKIKPLTDKENSIIIARHGLEWWTAWAIDYKIGQEKALKTDMKKYKYIYVLKQISGKTELMNSFNEPDLTKISELIYKTEYFELYKYKTIEN